MTGKEIRAIRRAAGVEGGLVFAHRRDQLGIISLDRVGGANVVGVVLMVIGAVWFFQGINVLPGSFMTGQTRWAINGGIAFLVGVGLWVASRRR